MGPWPFFVKRTVRTAKTIKASPEKTLEILHDAPAMITLNPLVLSYKTTKNDPNTYVIKDSLTILGWNTTSEYTATVEETMDGVKFYIKAPGSTSSETTWKVTEVENDPDAVEVEEVVEVEAPFLTMFYIVHVIRKSHETLFSHLETRLTGGTNTKKSDANGHS